MQIQRKSYFEIEELTFLKLQIVSSATNQGRGKALEL
jgi:hypothetical protein